MKVGDLVLIKAVGQTLIPPIGPYLVTKVFGNAFLDPYVTLCGFPTNQVFLSSSLELISTVGQPENSSQSGNSKSDCLYALTYSLSGNSSVSSSGPKSSGM